MLRCTLIRQLIEIDEQMVKGQFSLPFKLCTVLFCLYFSISFHIDYNRHSEWKFRRVTEVTKSAGYEIR